MLLQDKMKLLSSLELVEVIRIDADKATIQVYEETDEYLHFSQRLILWQLKVSLCFDGESSFDPCWPSVPKDELTNPTHVSPKSATSK